jgi:ABC-2 type transport system permease protein
VSLRRTLAISRRIAQQFRRDERTLALLFVAPIVILALLGWVIRDQAPPAGRVAIVNQAGPLAQLGVDRLATAITDAGLIYVPAITDEAAARAALANDDLDVAIVVPASLPADVLAGRPTTITVITPGVSPTSETTYIGQLQTAVRSAVGGAVPTIDHQTIYGDPSAGFLDTFAPALVGFLVFFLVFVLTGISFLRERVGGTLERLLATPVRRSEIAVGYSAGFTFFATLQSVVVLTFLLMSVTVPAIGPFSSFNIGLGVYNAGSPWLAFLITFLLGLVAVNLGIFLSTFARTELQIVQFIPIVVVPQALLAGIIWPVDSLPGILQPIARLLPMTYGIEGLREILVKGADLTARTLQIDVLVLAAMAIALAGAAMATIRREVV